MTPAEAAVSSAPTPRRGPLSAAQAVTTGRAPRRCRTGRWPKPQAARRPGPRPPRRPALYQINIRIMLRDIARAHGRAATPDDIADAVALLALGTTLVTGPVLVVDGGRAT